MALPLLLQLGSTGSPPTAGFNSLLGFWTGGAGQGAAQEEAGVPFGRGGQPGSGGWGAGLNARRRQRDYTARRLSELDPPPKPVIVKPGIETPATALVPLVDDGSAEYEQVLQALIWLDESGLLDE